jgi:ABC-type uncharacterized transport system involved in gliding motility auxiliary subunit
MKAGWKRWAPGGLIIAAAALVFALVWFVLKRQTDVPFQVALAVAALGALASILLDPARAKSALTGRQVRYGSNALLTTLAFLGILVVLNFLASRAPRRVDLTEDKTYTLSSETKLFLEELKSPARIIGFFTEDATGTRDSLRLLLDQYKAESSSQVDYEFLDPNAHPLEAERYNVTRDATLVVTMGEAFETVTLTTEEEITRALVRLANPEERKVYFLTGHGEGDLENTAEIGFSSLKDSLVSKNYEVANWNSIDASEAPADALVIVVPGLKAPLTLRETDLLKAYLEKGGGLVVMEDPTPGTSMEGKPDPLLDYLRKAWGIAVNDDVVVDLSSSQPFVGVAYQYANHPITERLQNLASYFRYARSLTTQAAGDESPGAVALVSSSQNAWGETDFEALLAGDALGYDEGGDTAAPLTLAAVAEDTEMNSRVAVFGDSDFGSNADFYVLANGDLAVNAIDWAAKQDKLISITPKQVTQRYIVPPTVQTTGLIFLVSVVGLPAITALVGVSTWWTRRKRA